MLLEVEAEGGSQVASRRGSFWSHRDVVGGDSQGNIQRILNNNEENNRCHGQGKPKTNYIHVREKQKNPK